MKKLTFLLVFNVLCFAANDPGCKKQDSMYAIADAKDRQAVFFKLYSVGECTFVNEIKVIKYDGYLKKVLADDGNYYWVINQ